MSSARIASYAPIVLLPKRTPQATTRRGAFELCTSNCAGCGAYSSARKISERRRRRPLGLDVPMVGLVSTRSIRRRWSEFRQFRTWPRWIGLVDADSPRARLAVRAQVHGGLAVRVH